MRNLTYRQKKKKAKEYYAHFKERLKERYGLEITFEEWLELSSAEFEMIGDKENGTCFGKVLFKGSVLWVYKETTAYEYVRTVIERPKRLTQEADGSVGKTKNYDNAA